MNRSYGSQRQLADRFKVSLSFVRNLLRHYHCDGTIEPKRRGGYLEPYALCNLRSAFFLTHVPLNDVIFHEFFYEF